LIAGRGLSGSASADLGRPNAARKQKRAGGSEGQGPFGGSRSPKVGLRAGPPGPQKNYGRKRRTDTLLGELVLLGTESPVEVRLWTFS
jgi:hypothetical protein